MDSDTTDWMLRQMDAHKHSEVQYILQRHFVDNAYSGFADKL